MTRFCFVTTFYPPYSFGGDGIFVQRLAGELAARGHTVEVIHCVDSYRLLAGREPRGSYAQVPGVSVHGLRSPWGPLSPLATHQTGQPLSKQRQIGAILDRGFDVIHYHNISLVGGPGVLALGQAIKLYTLHEYWLVCPTHTLFRYNRAPCSQPHCTACSLVHGRPPQWWRSGPQLASAVRHVDAFIAPSRFSQEAHRRMGLDLPTVHLPNFVPEAASADAGDEADQEVPAGLDPYFLFVGRLEKIKGLHTLIPVFRRWRKARLVVAGGGGEAERLRRQAAGDANITFLGPQATPALDRLYRDAIALIVPSINYEMFPLVMLEAFRQRTPVIARNLGALPEIVAEAGGMTYSSDEELIAALERLRADADCRAHLGCRAYRAFREKWSAEAHLNSYFDLIAGLAERRPAWQNGGDAA
jgi:glycosyltransferase involved in cell wall biosynthesis